MKSSNRVKPSMTHTVLEALRNDINNCVYENGMFMTESEISEKFQVSKTPAREALNTLCQEGLLDKIPRRGYMIKSLSVTELQALFQYRTILEKASVELAIRFASDEEIDAIEKLATRTVDPNKKDWLNNYNAVNNDFHLSVTKLTKNQYLVQSMQQIMNMLRRDLIHDMQVNSLKSALSGHILVYEAIKERDLEKALRITADQLEVVEKRLYVI